MYFKHGSPKDGAFWVRFKFLGNRGLAFKHVSCPPLFAERNGYMKYYPIGFGWRVHFMPKHPTPKQIRNTEAKQ